MFMQRQFFGCCCQLETGTKIVGIIGIIYFLLETISLICVNSDLDSFFFGTIVTRNIFVVASVIGFCTSISLLYGAFTKRKPFIYAWIIVNIISFIIEALISLYILILFTIVSFASAFIFFVCISIGLGIYYHIIYSVNYYYKTMENIRAEEKQYTIYV